MYNMLYRFTYFWSATICAVERSLEKLYGNEVSLSLLKFTLRYVYVLVYIGVWISRKNVLLGIDIISRELL